MDIKSYSAILIGLLLVLTPSVLAAVTVTRSLPSSAARGSTVTVTLNMVVSGTAPSAVGITEYFPAGWTVSSPTFNAVDQGDRLEWLFWSGGTPVATRSITYRLTVPQTASGTATFSGTVDTGNTTNIGGTTTLSISGGATTTTTTTTTTTIPYPAYATRILPSSARAGTSFTVSLRLYVDETSLPNAVGISEVVPSGWTVSSVSNNGNYFASDNRVEWLFWAQGNPVADTTVTYTITPPVGATGTGTFAGTVDYGGATNPTIGGSTTVSLTKKKKSSNDEFTVTLPASAFANSQVKIRVIDSDTKDPVDKAQVDVFLGNDKYTGKKVAYNATDKNGTFTFIPAEAGKYMIYVDKSDYDLYKVALTVASGAPTTTTVPPTTTTAPPATTTTAPPVTTVPPTTTPPTTPKPVTTTTVPPTTEPPVTTQPPAPTTTRPTTTTDNSWMWILLIVVIVLAIAAYFLMKGKGKGAEKPKNGNGKKAKDEKAEE